ncbi:MAG: alpha/beta fold hydrolase [Lachnospiraceae bacterium]|nr:alpha/beta fold hydrolase [Lachnospiraceae bacterium]
MKKLITLIIATVCIVSLVACSEKTEHTSDVVVTTQTTETEDGIGTEESTEINVPTIEATMSKPAEIMDVSETEKSFTFYREDYKISGKVYFPEGEGPFPTVIISSGAGVTYTYSEGYAKEFVKEGIACVVFNYARYKEATILTNVADLYIVMDGVQSMPKIDQSNLFLWGHSYGGLTTTYVATQRAEEVKGMILLEPSYQLNAWADEMEGEEIPDTAGVTDAYVKDLSAFDIFELIPNYTRPVVVFNGNAAAGLQEERDKFMAELMKGVELFPSAELITIDGANHSFSGEAQAPLMEKAIEFVKQNIDNNQ